MADIVVARAWSCFYSTPPESIVMYVEEVLRVGGSVVSITTGPISHTSKEIWSTVYARFDSLDSSVEADIAFKARSLRSPPRYFGHLA